MYAGDASHVADPSSRKPEKPEKPGDSAPAGDPRFERALTLLHERVKKPVFDAWFARLSFLGADEEVIRLGTPNQFAKEWIEKSELRDKLALALRDAFGAALTPELVILGREDGRDPERDAAEAGDKLDGARTASPTATEPTAGGQGGGAPHATPLRARELADAVTPAQGVALPSAFPTSRKARIEADSSIQLKDEYTFESYVVGPKSNSLAHAAANAVAKHPGREFNPLFIHSAVGLGKTHLLQATCHELLKRDPRPRILYLSCEEFLNRYVTAIKDKALEPFRFKHRSVDVLVIDDIHFLADKPQFQEEFFHTFNALHNAQRQVILSADCHPEEIPTLEDRLISRFKSGLVARIDPPEYETRCAIIKRKAAQRGQTLDDDVVQLLAQRIDSNIREIEGALNRLIGTASLSNVKVELTFARAVLADVLGDDGGHVHVHDIAEAVVAKLRVKLTDLQSKRRTKKIAFARQVCMYLARELTEMTLADIGGHFGGRDHTTVLYALEKIERQVASSPELKATIEEIKREARARRSTP